MNKLKSIYHTVLLYCRLANWYASDLLDNLTFIARYTFNQLLKRNGGAKDAKQQTATDATLLKRDMKAMQIMWDGQAIWFHSADELEAFAVVKSTEDPAGAARLAEHVKRWRSYSSLEGEP
jgi:hypothetical protein